MDVWLIASSIKMITKRVVAMYRFQSAGNMRVLQQQFANTAAKIAIKRVYHNRLENRFIIYQFMSRTAKYITFYA